MSIPEEAIEAAAKAEWEFHGGASDGGATWDTDSANYLDYLRRGAERALTAAAPHIRTTCDMEAYAHSFNEGYDAAMAQHLAPDIDTATEWLEDQKVKARDEALARVLLLADAYAPVEAEDALISPNQIRCAVASSLPAEERTIMTHRTAPYESFEEWHGDEPDECPLCNPHVCDDHCHNCEEPK